MMDMEVEGKTLETSASPCHNGEGHTDQTPKISDYEKSREERIKENLQRMQKLGVVDLSLQVKSFLTPKRAPKNSSNRKNPRPSPLSPSEPPRRSSRLQNVAPVSYSEEPRPKKKRYSGDEYILLREGLKPEVYTEEHEELLGSTEKSWELFVDGYGKDGKRIYDPIQGKTCHQCRQKTLGLRTHCSECNMVQGQFCGDCLYMRYGEHVVEANENPNWICPVCRGICNCSLCRTGKGWPPTGPLYKKITRLGFQSVAHYLIQTRRSQTNVEKDQGSNKSLASPGLSLQTESKESLNVDGGVNGLPLSEHGESPKVSKVNDGSQTDVEKDQGSNKSLLSPDLSLQTETKESLNVDGGINGLPLSENEESPKLPKVNDGCIGLPLAENEESPKVGIPKPQSEDKKVDGHGSGKENEVHFSDEEHDNSNITLESITMVKRSTGPSPDSISLMLRQRKHGKSNAQSSKKHEEALNVQQVTGNAFSENTSKFSRPHPVLATPNSDCIAGRLRSRFRTI